MKKAMYFSTAIFVIEIILLQILLPTFPAKIPIHWNWEGQPNHWAECWWLTFVPIITFLPVLSLYSILSAMKKHNVKNHLTERTASIAIVLSKLIFTLIFVSVLIAARELSIRFTMDRVIYTISGIVLIILGICLPGIKQNPTIGVRTKWTLKSETVWKKTSILCGWLFGINGVMFMLCQILLPDIYNMFVPLALLALGVPIIYVYSHAIYKNEQSE